ncbi:hypothetical protein BDW74DRAFT_159507 [Aspergillus multicolor]|uniref:uncharacterized protein n=1 Tax=Aspergillus multicolor TaxID=41759 RepID=UPI003CCD4E62
MKCEAEVMDRRTQMSLSRAPRGHAPSSRVPRAGISHEYGLLLGLVAALPVCGAGVDGVLVVEALADRITLDDLVAHCHSVWLGIAEKIEWVDAIGEIDSSEEGAKQSMKSRSRGANSRAMQSSSKANEAAQKQERKPKPNGMQTVRSDSDAGVEFRNTQRRHGLLYQDKKRTPTPISPSGQRAGRRVQGLEKEKKGKERERKRRKANRNSGRLSNARVLHFDQFQCPRELQSRRARTAPHRTWARLLGMSTSMTRAAPIRHNRSMAAAAAAATNSSNRAKMTDDRLNGWTRFRLPGCMRNSIGQSQATTGSGQPAMPTDR